MALYHNHAFDIWGVQLHDSEIIGTRRRLVERINEDQTMLIARSLRLEELIGGNTTSRFYDAPWIEEPSRSIAT